MALQTLDLEVLRDGEVIETRSFSQSVVLIGRLPEGRDGANDVVLNSGAVSGLHAKLLFERGEVTAVDCSRNGTFVNGELLRAPKQLGLGDQIEIAAFTIRWRVGSEDVLVLPPEDLEVVEDDFDGLPTVSPGPPPPEPLPLEELDLVPGATLEPDLNFEELEVPPSASQARRGSKERGHGAGAPRALLPTGPLPVISQAGFGDHGPGPMFESPGVMRETREGRERAPGSELAGAYRALAKEFGASGWGRPPRATSSTLARVLDSTRRELDDAGDVGDSALWTNWLAHEICGLDPIQALLDDSLVSGIVVQGDAPVRVLRASTWEVAARRFSCPEAVFAAIERWTDRRLAEKPIECVRGGLSIRVFGGGLTPQGPVICVQRGARSVVSIEELVMLQVLTPPAAELILGALAASASVLIYGDAHVEPSIFLEALRSGVPDDAVVALVRRASQWSPVDTLVVDGRAAPAEDVWRCVESVAPQWLFIEEVGLTDASPLCSYARHRGGGTVATLTARDAVEAVARMTALLAASLASTSSACRAVIGESFDLAIGLTSRANGHSRIASIAEVRGGGDLAELFTWRADTSTLEATGIQPAILGVCS